MKKKYKQGMNPNSRAGCFKKGNHSWKFRKEEMLSEKNPMWKDKRVGYNALHGWIKRHKPKSLFCEKCRKTKKLDISNVSGKYKRDISDFRWLCRRCHMIDDGRYEKAINNIKNAKKQRGKNGKFKKI